MMTNEQNIRAILECFFSGYKDEIIDLATKRILDTIDAEPVRHARNTWIETLGYHHCEFKCSNCGVEAWIVEGGELDGGNFDYCPGCGAKIVDGGEE